MFVVGNETPFRQKEEVGLRNIVLLRHRRVFHYGQALRNYFSTAGVKVKNQVLSCNMIR